MRHSGVVLSSDELMLAGEVFLPAECGGIYPAVCLCHGIPAVPYVPGEAGGYPELAARFCGQGFISLVFNFRGCGPSQGNIDMPGWTHDLEAAIDFLAMLPEADKHRIFLLGSSGGAAACVHAAAHDKRVAGAVLLACPAEFDFMAAGQTAEPLIARFREIGIIRDTDFPTSVEKWLQGFEEIAPLAHIGKVAPKPVLLVHGDRDEVVPLAHAHRLYQEAGQPKELLVLAGAGHRLRQDGRAVDAAMQWLLKTAC